MVRNGVSHYAVFGKLFHQLLVDAYVTMETCRLDYVRQMQTTLRSETYQGLQDQIQVLDSNIRDIGRRIILPPSFIGSPRDQFAQYQNAMALVQQFGKPDLVVTILVTQHGTKYKVSSSQGKMPLTAQTLSVASSTCGARRSWTS